MRDTLEIQQLGSRFHSHAPARKAIARAGPRFFENDHIGVVHVPLKGKTKAKVTDMKTERVTASESPEMVEDFRNLANV